MKTKKITPRKFLIYVPLFIWTIIALFPIYWTITTAFKTPVAVFGGPFYVPFLDFSPTLKAWHYIFVDSGPEFFRAFLNSTIIGITSSLLALSIGSLAAYGLARIRYRLGRFGNKDIALFMISQRLIPPIIFAIPYLIMFRILGLLDTRLGMIITYTMFNLPFVVWLMRDFFTQVPVECEEAAIIDGCSHFQVFVRIVLPLSVPGLIATYMFCVVFAWNEFLYVLILSFQRAQTLPLLIAGQSSVRGPEWWNISAVTTVAILPMMIIFLFLEKHIVRGLSLGAIK